VKLVFNPISGSLDYVASVPGDVGITFPLAASLGGTGVANGALSTLTLPNFPITIAGGVTGGTYTLPATAGGGTVALLNTANVFTGINLFTRGTDSSNVFLGNAGNATVTGANNVAVGDLAMVSVSTGFRNFALGYGTLFSNLGGQDNVAIGVTALQDNTSGVRNIGIGFNAGSQNRTGNDNTIIGTNAGKGVDTKSNSQNVVIGSSAGFLLTTGTANIFIGFSAGYRQSTQNNLLIIDNQERASAAVDITNSIIYGVMAATPAAQTLRLNAVTSIVQETAATATIVDAGIIQGESTGTPAAGFGVAQLFKLETSTAGTNKNAGRLWSKWVVPTNGSETAAVGLDAFYNSAAQEFIRGEGDASGVKIGLYAVTAVARATTGIAEAAFVENAGGTAVNVDSTFGGYTMQQIAQALQDIGILT